jgi:death on curing protein
LRKEYLFARERALRVLRRTALTLEKQLSAESGGVPVVRDEGWRDFQQGKPKPLFACGTPALFDFAAGCGFSLVKNHPYVDGDMRTGFIVVVVF